MEVNRALRDPSLIEKLAQQGTTAIGGTPEEFRTLITTEIKNWSDTARQAGIKVR
jgi:tripartite-type tricarboxylate transporter receptor subunit TctC